MAELATVTVAQGKLFGKKVSSENGTFYSFLGIPYAKPPVGPLRFKPPQAPESWEGERDATIEGAVAPQITHLLNKYVGKEDCLYLNVHTPQVSASILKPVMFWIHGGAFQSGSGSSKFYGPDYIVAEDVVLVTINYRLGVLGFLDVEGSDVVANNGLRDQVMALRWVRDNISQFGGDPENVTIFGESAGATSVHALLLAPSSEGLFHKAIAQSGTVLLCQVKSTVSNQRAFRLGKALGCETKDPQKLVEFLRTIPDQDLILAQGKALTDQEKSVISTPFIPTDESGPNAFIPGDPLRLLHEGKFQKVPYLTGVTSAEGKLFITSGFDPATITNERLLPRSLRENLPPGVRYDLGSKVKDFYFGDKTVCSETMDRYVKMLSDAYFLYSLFLTVKLQLKHTDCPVYAYQYDHKRPPQLDKLIPDFTKNVPGSGHGEELIFLFLNSYIKPDFGAESSNAKVRSNMVKLWTNFSKTGDPNSSDFQVKWPQLTRDSFDFLNISPELTLLKDFAKDRMDFWEEIYLAGKKL
uniref:Carboxylic ester hydrolase n=1 Tax=Timema genevievae TaxID=629358 RepID=A0A7R9JUJ3_TIMGE|nr:unnamed protein product [Timema genevievae]